MTTVLLVSGEPLIGDMVALFFEAEGYEFASIGDANDISEAIETLRPAIVIQDLNMLDDSGMDALSHTKGMLRGSSVELIVLTADRRPQSIRSAFSIGISDYIIKPFMPAELVSRCIALVLPENPMTNLPALQSPYAA